MITDPARKPLSSWIRSASSKLMPALGISLVLVLSSVVGASATVRIEPVITAKGNQWVPFANDRFIVYLHEPAGNPDRHSAILKPLSGGSGTKLNPSGARGEPGGFDPLKDRVIYQQRVRRTGNLLFYDLDTGRRSMVPGVNTKAYEWGPRISSTFVMFGRDHLRGGEWYGNLLVHHRDSGVTRKLGTWKWGPNRIWTGSVGDRYAAYTLCTRRNCGAYLYDWTTRTQRRIPTLDGRPQYAPIVDELNGVVYVTRSGKSCGQNVAIWRLPLSLSGKATKVVALPSGTDTGAVSSITANPVTGQMDLYLARYRCSKETSDIYVARGVDQI